MRCFCLVCVCVCVCVSIRALLAHLPPHCLAVTSTHTAHTYSLTHTDKGRQMGWWERVGERERVESRRVCCFLWPWALHCATHRLWKQNQTWICPVYHTDGSCECFIAAPDDRTLNKSQPVYLKANSMVYTWLTTYTMTLSFETNVCVCILIWFIELQNYILLNIIFYICIHMYILLVCVYIYIYIYIYSCVCVCVCV